MVMKAGTVFKRYGRDGRDANDERFTAQRLYDAVLFRIFPPTFKGCEAILEYFDEQDETELNFDHQG